MPNVQKADNSLSLFGGCNFLALELRSCYHILFVFPQGVNPVPKRSKINWGDYIGETDQEEN